ncbi:MAG: DUF6445 family protein [Pseudomonadota bacterium]
MTGVTTNWDMHVARFGSEGQPVVVIDGFAPDPRRFTEDAAFLAFRPIGEHYPGLRAVVAPVMLRDLLGALEPVVAETFGIAAFEVIDAFYSLVTTPPSALAPIQRLPHFDGVEDGQLALLHYLSPEPRGGTAFYRHRATGFESVDAARLGAYRTALDADLRRVGLPDPAYIAGDTALFEQVARFDAVFNRAILYRSNTLHCADIPEDMTLSADPATGRLTVNTFLGAAPGRRATVA